MPIPNTEPVASTLLRVQDIEFDIDDVQGDLLQLGATRAGVLEDAVRLNNADQQDRSDRINQLNQALALLQQARPNFDVADSSLNGPLNAEQVQFIRDTLGDVNGEDPFDQYVDASDPNNLTVENDGDYQRLLDVTRDQVDRASANSQLELIQLQALINRRNQSLEFLTNLIQRFSNLRDRIVGNFRN